MCLQLCGGGDLNLHRTSGCMRLLVRLRDMGDVGRRGLLGSDRWGRGEVFGQVDWGAVTGDIDGRDAANIR